MKHDCDISFQELMDFADGLLNTAESERIQKHLTNCERCRETVDLLQRSMQAATAVWQNNYESRRTNATFQIHKKRWLQAAAAGLLIVVALSVVVLLKEAKNGSATWPEIERHLVESQRAAEIMAATELLQEKGSNKDVVMDQYRYVATAYCNTEAGKKAKRIIANN